MHPSLRGWSVDKRPQRADHMRLQTPGGAIEGPHAGRQLPPARTAMSLQDEWSPGEPDGQMVIRLPCHQTPADLL